MARYATMDQQTLEMALVGYESEKQRVEAAITQIQSQLGHRGPGVVRAYYLKESFQLFWEYKQFRRAETHLQTWMTSAMRSRLDPFKRFVRMLRSHLDRVLPWTRIRLSNAAVEGMNNKIKSISHRSFGFRTAKNFIAAIYHCCARLPLPVER
jgi:transposase